MLTLINDMLGTLSPGRFGRRPRIKSGVGEQSEPGGVVFTGVLLFFLPLGDNGINQALVLELLDREALQMGARMHVCERYALRGRDFIDGGRFGHSTIPATIASPKRILRS